MSGSVIAFSDDGHGVQSEDMMRQAMLEARDLGKLIVAHCEDNSLLRGGYIHDGQYAREHGHGICSESEYGQIARDLKLAEETGCSYHVCHISAKESVELIRQAKKRGVDVTCETAPHYLILDDSALERRPFQDEPAPERQDRQAGPHRRDQRRDHRHYSHRPCAPWRWKKRPKALQAALSVS